MDRIQRFERWGGGSIPSGSAMSWMLGRELGHRSLPDSGVLILNHHYDPAVLDRVLLERPDLWVISDCYDIVPPSQVPVEAIPLNLAWWWDPQQGRSLEHFNLDLSYPTQDPVSFMLFKPNQVGLIMLKIMEYLGITTTKYVCNITEYSQVQANVIKYNGGDWRVDEFLSWANLEWDSNTPAKWYEGRRNPSRQFPDHWNRFLQYQVFGPAAVALISERTDVGTWDSMCFTEKSIYPMLGCNFPIWIGGRLQAQAWQEHGFDVFDDVIDHSYQHRSHWLERAFYALFDNRIILTDVDHARDMRCWHWRRLMDNRQRVLDNRLGQQIIDHSKQHPLAVQLYKYITSVGYSNHPW